MKVLEVFGEPVSNGGQESFVFNVIDHMNMDDLEIDVLTPYYCDNEHYRKMIEESGGKLVCLNLQFNPGKSRFNIKEALNKYLSENRYDVVHVHSGSISVLTIVASCAKKNGVKKVIVHSHCGIERINMKNIILRNIASFSLEKNADVYCACSEIAGQAKYCTKVQDRVQIIKNGVDTEKFTNRRNLNSQIRQQLGISNTTFVVGHVGRFSYQKNHDFLIDIFSDILKKKNDSVLMLIGDGETKEDVCCKIKEYGIVDKVLFIGNVTNVNEYMQVMDLFLLPSRFEGLPIVGVEAQASGLEIVTSENVSPELKLTEHVHYLPLDAGSVRWAEKVLEYSENREHYDSSEDLSRHGYRIDITSEYLRNLYLG